MYLSFRSGHNGPLHAAIIYSLSRRDNEVMWITRPAGPAPRVFRDQPWSARTGIIGAHEDCIGCLWGRQHILAYSLELIAYTGILDVRFKIYDLSATPLTRAKHGTGYKCAHANERIKSARRHELPRQHEIRNNDIDIKSINYQINKAFTCFWSFCFLNFSHYFVSSRVVLKISVVLRLYRGFTEGFR